jgi:hypothetical protein
MIHSDFGGGNFPEQKRVFNSGNYRPPGGENDSQ